MCSSVIRWELRPLKLYNKLLLSSQQGCLPRPPRFLWRLSSHSWDHGEASNLDALLYIPYPPPIDQPMRELCFITYYQHCFPDWFRTKQGITLSQSEHSLGLLSQSQHKFTFKGKLPSSLWLSWLGSSMPQEVANLIPSLFLKSLEDHWNTAWKEGEKKISVEKSHKYNLDQVL